MVQIPHYRGGRLHAFAGSWSPDGTEIVFHLRGVRANGSTVNQLFIIDAKAVRCASSRTCAAR